MHTQMAQQRRLPETVEEKSSWSKGMERTSDKPSPLHWQVLHKLQSWGRCITDSSWNSVCKQRCHSIQSCYLLRPTVSIAGCKKNKNAPIQPASQLGGSFYLDPVHIFSAMFARWYCLLARNVCCTLHTATSITREEWFCWCAWGLWYYLTHLLHSCTSSTSFTYLTHVPHSPTSLMYLIYFTHLPHSCITYLTHVPHLPHSPTSLMHLTYLTHLPHSWTSPTSLT